jgi:hypothetical protein
MLIWINDLYLSRVCQSAFKFAGRMTIPYIKSIVDRIEVDDHVIRIIGEQATLEEVIAGDQNAGPNVRGFAQKWRAAADAGRT